MDGNSTGLVGDPKRQAIPALQGFAYQIWQSVYKWVLLKEDEILFLEGAEDVDILGPENVETIQIKKLQKTVTLRSNEVLEAIAHFWEHQNKNPEKKIIFHFLTTAERGKETKSPFGDQCGLEYWDRCKRPGVELASLRRFLKSQEKLPNELRQFVDIANDDELRDRLIERIVWDTGKESKEFIEKRINTEVAYYGKKFNLQPYESQKVVPHLLKHVWDVVCKEKESDRRLEHSDFMQLFQDATQELVSKSELQRLRQIDKQYSNILPNALRHPIENFATTEPLSDVQIAKTFQSPSFVSVERLAQRETFVNKTCDLLNAKGILTLKGSTGMGKSITAMLVTKVDNVSNWRWIHVRGMRAEQIREQFYHAAISFSHKLSNANIVIDDLSFSEQSHLYENALAGFLYTVMSRNGRIIITTQGEMPSRIALQFNIVSDSVIEVPPLENDEIKQLAINHGCPPNESLAMWTKIIWATTKGHPQLAHARVRNLEETGWPVPTAVDDIFGTKSLEKVRLEARNLIRDGSNSQKLMTRVL